MTIVPKDVIFLSESTESCADRWVAMNVFARTSVGLSSEVFELLGRIANDPEAGGEGPFHCWRIEYFSNEAGLLADPSRFRRNVDEWEELCLTRAELIAELKTHCILVDDETAYRKRFKPKRNLLDREHFGNFHQQHGQHMALARRKDPTDWWMRQKFTEDQLSVRPDTLYGAIQSKFLEAYTETRISEGMTVVDLGCGTGVYSNMMARRGANVLGIDPSEEYLNVARANAVPGTRFENMKIGEVGALDKIPASSADMIFMSDALLFYFVPFYPGQNADIHTLLKDIRRILKPGGLFVSMEPHGVFYLMPWLGAVDRPFVVVTEYLNKSFGIVPPLSWLIQQVTRTGFAVTDMREIVPGDYFEKIDPRGYHFASEFPLWHLIEFRPFSS
ncbi:class I SAM-dependent methyltransferase [Methylocystis sp. B8]|uniref:class I SAM-dependent methyltransferase n=1 Tax=Methylocystis sp. B8 TaxID=544938 RepID=UPI0010FE0D05|nr:class I SAM-dependent methyltransferase [Methylocystis sp. B8]TLG77613.1 methyltransferase domain-containing protein [Methylocystis sp. B8]